MVGRWIQLHYRCIVSVATASSRQRKLSMVSGLRWTHQIILDAVLRMATEFRPSIATCFVDSLHTAIVITWLERKFFDQLNSTSLSLTLILSHDLTWMSLFSIPSFINGISNAVHVSMILKSRITPCCSRTFPKSTPCLDMDVYLM